ncbi:MAG: hypothetical protein LBF72_00920 [Holosporales bacterium]|jgi:trigger factor|nr:hypothetical protein [Holosporales bacterium]
MQISEEVLGTTGLRLTAKLTAEEVKDGLERWAKAHADQVKIPGFRVGHAPVQQIIKHSKMERVLQEVAMEYGRPIVDDKLQDGCRIIGAPFYATPKTLSDGEELEFSIFIDLIRPVEIRDFKELKINTISCPVSNAFFEKSLQSFKEEYYVDEEVSNDAPEPEDEPFRRRVSTIVTRNGKEIKRFELDQRIIEHHSIDEFFQLIADAVRDKKIGDVVEVVHVFSPQFHIKEMAKQKVHIRISVDGLIRKRCKEFTEEDVKEFKVDSMEAFDKSFRERLSRERERGIALYNKRIVMDALDAAYVFPVSIALVNADFEEIWLQAQDELNEEIRKEGEEFADQITQGMKDDYRKVAERRVRLGIVIEKIAAKYGIAVSDDDYTREVLMEIALTPPNDREAILSISPGGVLGRSAYARLLENAVVKKVLEEADVTEREVDEDELEKLFEDVVP